MAHKTSISWTDYASNPIRARRIPDGKKGWWCSHVSAGCEHCYSETVNKRWGNQVAYRAQDADLIEFYLDENELKSWSKLPVGSKVFVCDMTDLFHENVPDWMIERVFTEMGHAYQITFQVLTKRARRMLEIIPQLAIAGKEALSFAHRPLPNVWLGVSVENQRAADERIPLLLQTPAAVRFLSCEPLLGPLSLQVYPDSRNCIVCGDNDHQAFECKHALGGIDWVICGGESGSHRRSMDLEWALSLRDQCAFADIPFFFKQQNGTYPGTNPTLDGHIYHEFPK